VNRGMQVYLKHFFGAVAVMLVGAVLGVGGVQVLPAVFLCGALLYVLVLTAGLVLRVGPFSRIGQLFVQSAAEDNARAKPPWEG
jgi:hypothetical protein